MQLGTQIKPGNLCGNLGSNCGSWLSSASQLLAEQTRSTSCRLAGSRGVRGGAGCCHPCQQLPDQSVPCSAQPEATFLPQEGTEGRSSVQRLSFPERACAYPQGSSWASFNRFGEHCLVRYLLSCCSMANPGWREESLTIADSWVPAAA